MDGQNDAEWWPYTIENLYTNKTILKRETYLYLVKDRHYQHAIFQLPNPKRNEMLYAKYQTRPNKIKCPVCICVQDELHLETVGVKTETDREVLYEKMCHTFKVCCFHGDVNIFLCAKNCKLREKIRYIYQCTKSNLSLICILCMTVFHFLVGADKQK